MKQGEHTCGRRFHVLKELNGVYQVFRGVCLITLFLKYPMLIGLWITQHYRLVDA